LNNYDVYRGNKTKAYINIRKTWNGSANTIHKSQRRSSQRLNYWFWRCCKQ